MERLSRLKMIRRKPLYVTYSIPEGQDLPAFVLTAYLMWQLFQNSIFRIGTLEVGKYGDLIVLSDDYFTVDLDDIRSITSVLTIVGGDVVHADAEFTRLALE
jgi:hypothetical protein